MVFYFYYFLINFFFFVLGGIVDVIVCEVLLDRFLKEIIKVSGGVWGGLYVN